MTTNIITKNPQILGKHVFAAQASRHALEEEKEEWSARISYEIKQKLHAAAIIAEPFMQRCIEFSRKPNIY